MHAVWIWSALLVLAFWRVDATPGSEAYSVIFDPRVNFNATGGVGSFAKRGVFGSSLAALFAEVTRFQMTVLKGLLASCAPDQPVEEDPRLVRRQSRCPEVSCVDVEPFKLALLRAHAGLHRCALGLLAKLPRSAAAHEMRVFLEVLRRRSKSLTFSEKCARVVNLFLARDAEFAPAKGECVDMKLSAIVCMTDSIYELRLLSDVLDITQARTGEVLRESASGLQGDLPIMEWNPFLGFSRADILSKIITLLASASDTPAIVRMAELGVSDGRTSEHLLRAHSNLQMYLVDPYHLAGDEAGSDEARRLFHEAIDRTQPFRDRATFILQDSARAAAQFCPGSLDIVFVDGDHSYEAALVDLRLWWPLLRSGGRLIGHDYSMAHPGVVRAVHEFARDMKLPGHLSPDAVFMFQKE